MDAEVYEGSEVGDIGNDAFQGHAGFEVGDGLDVFAEGGGDELRSRVTTGLFEFLEDVAQGGFAHCIGDIALQIHLLEGEGLEGFGILCQGFEVDPQIRQDGFDDAIAFGVDGGVVQGIFAIADAEEASGLLEGFGAQFGDFEQGFAIAKCPILVPIRHDVVRNRRRDARHIGEQRRRGGVEVYPHIVHAAFHRFF